MKETAFLGAILCALALAGCTALPAPREAENMRPVQVLGVDAAPEGVRVTAISVTREDSRTYSATAKTTAEACAVLQAETGATLFYGHTETLLVGEALAAEGLAPLFTYVAEDEELRSDMVLFLVRGTAAEALSGSREPAAERLAAIAPKGAGLRGVLVDLSRAGRARVPALTLYKDGTLLREGYALLQGDALAGWERG
ncbi:MAG: hypothetical protein RR403_05455 [Pseudoflavonifractor sp.]